MTKTKAAVLFVIVSVLLPDPSSAQGVEATANVGWVSEYLYRGIAQNSSSASAGLDVTAGPIYVGTWAADVGEGSEVDLYGGLGVDLGGLALSAGGTGYFYTGAFDDTYIEANLGAGYGPITVDLALGTYRTEPEAMDYTFLSVTAESRGAYATFGTFGQDFSGEYGEVGYGFAVSDVDITAAWVISDGDLALLPSGKSNATLVLGVSKTFTLK